MCECGCAELGQYFSESEEWLLKFVAVKTEKVSAERTWQWLKGGYFKKGTVAMVCDVQEHALRVNLIKHDTDGHDVLQMCRLCGKSSEMVMHLSSGCPNST